MRVKSQWFKEGKARTPKEIAGAAAFNIWRIADNALKSMRKAGFDIEVGPQYFFFLSEFLAFLVMVADRIAFRRMNGEERAAFTGELANRVGETLADNWSELLGGAEAEYKAGFIELINRRADEYAEYDYEEAGSNFSFLRHLGYVLQEIMDERDHFWVTDQVMAIEAPEAVGTLEKAMRGFFGDAPQRQRSKAAAD